MVADEGVTRPGLARRVGRLAAAAALAGGGGVAGLFIVVAIVLSGYCGDNGCTAGQQAPSALASGVAALAVCAVVLAVMVCAGRVALGAEATRALGRLRFVGLSLLLLPMYPFAALGTIWVSHTVALGVVAGIIVAVVFVAAYLAAWSTLAGLVVHRRARDGIGPSAPGYNRPRG